MKLPIAKIEYQDQEDQVPAPKMQQPRYPAQARRMAPSGVCEMLCNLLPSPAKEICKAAC